MKKYLEFKNKICPHCNNEIDIDILFEVIDRFQVEYDVKIKKVSGKIITMSEAIENLKKHVKYMREERKKRNEEEYDELERLIEMSKENKIL